MKTLLKQDVLSSSAVVIGRIISITLEGVPIVDYFGNTAGPIEARLTVDPPHGECGNEWPPALLLFENNDRSLPVIIGFVRDTIQDKVRRQPLRRLRTLSFSAEEEILLECGKSSVLLRRDGKIVIKGGEIVSRASGANKVQGGVVRLN